MHMYIVTDIGGTFVRFGLYEKETIQHIQKYKVSDYPNFETALDLYLRDAGLGRMKILMATAAYNHEGIWKFVNQNPWEIDPRALAKNGYDIAHIINDFEAASWGLLTLDDKDLEVIQEGVVPEDLRTQCLLGPGTGLGLGYVIHTKSGAHVQKTHGGHMPLACISEDQWFIAQTVKHITPDAPIPVFEDVVSGPGMLNIYRAVCKAHGRLPGFKKVQDLLEHPDDMCVKDTLSLFHEYLGLFAANAVITGHAYDGLYLTGGVIDRLYDKKLFDKESFLATFLLDCVDSVRAELEQTPIYKITDPYLSFRGLVKAYHA